MELIRNLHYAGFPGEIRTQGLLFLKLKNQNSSYLLSWTDGTDMLMTH